MVKRYVAFLLAAIILLLPMMTALSEYCSTASHFTTGLIAINECIQGEGNVSFLLDIDVPTDVVIYSTGCEVYLGGSKEEKQHLEVGLYSVCIRSEGEFSVLIADEKAIGEADSLGDLLERMQEGTVLSSDIPGAVEDDMDASWESVTTPSDIYEMLPEQEADVFSAPDAMTSFTVVSEGNTVHLSFDAAACIPDDAEFVVQVLDPMSEEYVHYTDTALSAVPGPSQILALYDLSIMREGEEIEPQAPVMVTVDFGGSLPRDATLYAIHFPETESAAMTRPMHAPSLAPSALNTRMQQATSPRIETIRADYDGAGSATFVASSFSVFAIVYTVDFHWEVNGKMYNINIPGGDFVSFTDLVEVLGIAKEAVTKEFYGDADGSIDGKISAPLTQRDVIISEDTRKFVADVNSITFSTPKFLSVSKVDSSTTVGEIKDELGLECEYSAELAEEQIAEINAQIVDAEDWALICVQPFSSTEYLTVTMKNGDSFEIRVTDAQIRRRVISASGETYEITVTYGVDAQIPDDAELKVREIVEEDVDYQEYYDATVEKLGTAGTQGEVFVGNTVIQDCYAHIFDIEIWADGQKVEPAAYVAVSIKLLDVSEDEVFDLMVVHFSKDGLEIMELAENAEKAGVTELSFVTDEFSVYTIISSGTTTNLNGQSFAIGNANTNNFMMAIRQGNDRLQALHYSVTGDTVITTSENDISRWTFTSSTKGGNWYYISDSSGNYLNIGNGNNPYVTVSQNPQEIYVRANGNRVRLQLTNTDNSTAVNNYGGTTAGGFGPYNDQGNNEWFTLYNITVAEEGKVGVYVYVAAEQWKNNPEFMDLIGVGYTDPYDYFPAGVIYLDASFFDGKTNFSALIQSEEDWAEIVEALEKIDTSLLSGEGDPNRGNHIGEYARQAIGDLRYGASSQHTALFSNTGHAGYADLGYGFHLDVRFEANRITFYTGNNGLTDNSFGNAKDGIRVDTRIYIPGSIIQQPRNLVIPAGYRLVGYYNDPDFTAPWDKIGTPITQDEVAYIKITPQDNVILYYKPVPAGGGIVSVDAEGVNPETGVPAGTTATANPGYSFVGWYADEACTHLLSTGTTYVPTKGSDERWVDGTTYYAKFVENRVTLTFKAEENVDHLEMDNVPSDVVSYQFNDDKKTLTVVVNAVTGSPVTVKGVAENGYAIKEWTIDVRTEILTSADEITTAKTDDPEATNDLWTDRTYHVWAEVLKTITVTKEVKIIGTLQAQEVNGTVYFALKDLSRDSAPWIYNADGSIYTTSIQIENGEPKGTAQFVDLPAGTYEVWEVADTNAGSFGPGSAIAEGVVVSRIQTWISDTDTGNDVIVSDVEPNGSIKVINTLNRDGEAMTFWANKKWFTIKNSYADANAEANVAVPAGAWVDFTLYRVYADGHEEKVETIRLDGTANAVGEEEAWAAAFRDLPTVDDNGKSVSYYVKETAMSDLSEFGYYTTFNDTTYTNGGSISNVVAYGDVNVTKEIELPADISETEKYAFINALQITVIGPSEVAESRRIKRKLDKSSFTVTESTKTVAYGATTQSVKVLTLTASVDDLPAGTYTVAESGYNSSTLPYIWDSVHSWIKADKLPASQSSLVNTEQYGKVDIDVPVGVNVTDNHFTTTVNLLNSYVVHDIKATKVWNDLGFERADHPSVHFTLYRTDNNGIKTSVSTQIIGANQTGDNLTVTWENQPQAYTYSIEETPVKGYSLESITGNTSDGFVVKNKRAPIIKVVKTDQDGKPLAGATFSGSLITGTITTEITGEGEAKEAIVIDDSTVPLGTYTINEISSPTGYNQLEGPVAISVEEGETAGDIVVRATINGETSALVNAERPDVNGRPDYWVITIKNNPGVTLPSTGGFGTNLIYLIGILLTSLAGIGLLMKRRRRAAE